MRKFMLIGLCGFLMTGIFLAKPLSAKDSRLPTTNSGSTGELIRTLHEGSNFKPYTEKSAWEKRATYLKQQVLISAGLWPMPEKCPPNAMIYGRIDRDDYTIEKVYFQSHPGFYVTGNLYRPKNKTGPLPAILSPHGHWANGRLYEASDRDYQDQLAGGWEKHLEGAMYPMQARCANLAKLGCIVFFYDMIGYADNDGEKFPHRNCFRDMESNQYGLSVNGLQTWNSIRALDFLESLPEVDKSRIACTGASGGATQTFMLMCADDRLAAAAPVNMISAGEHQGGCICENNPLLRLGTDNVELAATFAPKPFIAPSATGDWTKNFLEHGYPEIQKTYELFDAKNNVASFRQTAPHNYNQVSREAVYNFFNEHLKLGHEGKIVEKHFTPVKLPDLSIWDAEHPRPKDGVDQAGLLTYWKDLTGKQIAALLPKTSADLTTRDAVLRPALVHILGGMPEPAESPATGTKTIEQLTREDMTHRTIAINVSGIDYTAELIFVDPKMENPEHNPSGVVYLMDRVSDASTHPIIEAIVRKTGMTLICNPNCRNTGNINSNSADLEGAPAKTTAWPIEFYACYNKSRIAQRATAALAIAQAADLKNVTLLNLDSDESAALTVLLTRPFLTGRLNKTIVNISGMDAALPKSERDENYLPLKSRYGVWPLASIGGTSPLTIYAHGKINQPMEWMTATFKAGDAVKNLRIVSDAKNDDVIDFILSK